MESAFERGLPVASLLECPCPLGIDIITNKLPSYLDRSNVAMLKFYKFLH